MWHVSMSYLPDLIRWVFILLTVIMGLSSGAAQTNLTDSLLHQGMYRHYAMHFPPNYPSGQQPYPLVMVLHGGSGTMTNIQGFSQMNPVSDSWGFVVVYPQGIGIAPPGYSWADGRNTSADQAGIDDVGFLNALVDEIDASYFIDSTRTDLSGFSNGGFMTMRMACEAPQKFAAMAALGCSMDTSLVQSCAPGQSVPMVIMAGTDDPAMPYLGGPMANPEVTPVVPVEEAVSFWVNQNECATEPVLHSLPDAVPDDNSTVDRFDYLNGTCNSEVRFYRVNGGGHTWPGVELPLQEAVLGETNEDIEGSEELWDFFNLFVNCGMVSPVAEQNSHEITVFPNPSAYRIQLIGLPVSSYSAELVSNTGQLIPIQVTDQSFSIQDLSPGMYLLRINYSGGYEVIRFFKE
jgi:polyhydroxybutyrate depolymerase